MMGEGETPIYVGGKGCCTAHLSPERIPLYNVFCTHLLTGNKNKKSRSDGQTAAAQYYCQYIPQLSFSASSKRFGN